MNIYDLNGEPRDLAWLHNKFGPVEIRQAPDGSREHRYRAAELRERTADAAIVVTVLDAAGRPVTEDVVFCWPDAPGDPAAGHLGKGVTGTTNANGDVGFGMGPGAFYFPPNQGPHSVWIHGGDSDLVLGLGMLGGTDHLHLNVTFQARPDDEPEPPPDPEPAVYNRFEARVLLYLDQIAGDLAQLRGSK